MELPVPDQLQKQLEKCKTIREVDHHKSRTKTPKVSYVTSRVGTCISKDMCSAVPTSINLFQSIRSTDPWLIWLIHTNWSIKRLDWKWHSTFSTTKPFMHDCMTCRVSLFWIKTSTLATTQLHSHHFIFKSRVRVGNCRCKVQVTPSPHGRKISKMRNVKCWIPV